MVQTAHEQGQRYFPSFTLGWLPVSRNILLSSNWGPHSRRCRSRVPQSPRALAGWIHTAAGRCSRTISPGGLTLSLLTFRGETWSGQVFVKTVMFGLQRHPPSPGRYEKETGRSHHQGKNAFLTLSLSIQEMGTVGSALLVTLKCHGISTAGYTRDQHTDRRL